MNLVCPLPVTDTEVITMAHGAGGLLTHKLLQSCVFDVLGNEQLNQQHDGAYIEEHHPLAFSTDSYVVTPVFFPGGNIGDLAVNGTVNDLAMCGANAKYLSLSFILEEGLPLSEFREILNSIRAAAIRAKVQIVTGDTKVVDKGKADKIFINTSGIGIVYPGAAIHHSRIEPGDKIIISGNIATHGIAIMSVRNGLEFESNIATDSTNLNHTVMKLVDEFGTCIRFMRDPTRGGVASVLNEIAEQTHLGFCLDQHCLPIDEQVEGACEMLGLDPLYVANEGIFIAIVRGAVADAFVSMLHHDGNGHNAAIIGEVTSDYPGKVIMKSRSGGRRTINYLAGEQLPRIC